MYECSGTVKFSEVDGHKAGISPPPPPPPPRPMLIVAGRGWRAHCSCCIDDGEVLPRKAKAGAVRGISNKLSTLYCIIRICLKFAQTRYSSNNIFWRESGTLTLEVWMDGRTSKRFEVNVSVRCIVD